MKRLFSVLLTIAMLFASGALADGAELVVNGSASVYMQADHVSASLGVTLNGEDLADVQQRANDTVAAIYDALKAAGLDEKEISTNYIYINPVYDYSDGGQRLAGYSVNNSLTIYTGNIDKIGAYIDAAFAAGANSFDSINFSVQDDSSARAMALELAVQDARRKAEVIAAASGMQLGEIDQIQEVDSNNYYTNSASGSVRYAEAGSAAYDAGTTVRAAQIGVTANVEITYELK